MNDGGSAFPVPMIPCDREGGMTEVRCGGMTLRDWFAGQALGALMRNAHDSHIHDVRDGVPTLDEFADDAYRVADAMLAERANKSAWRSAGRRRSGFA